MGATTTYDIKLRYTLDDRASKRAKDLADNLGRGARSSSALGGSLGRLGGVVAGAFGARAAGKALIGFNSTVEDTKLQIAGMLALAKHSDLSTEVGRADRLFANLQKRAMSLPGTTAEYAKMAGMLTQPLTDAGFGMKTLEDLTVSATVAAKALGIESEVAARDIDQALRGQFRSVDVFTGKLLGSIGFKGESGRAKYNAMSSQARAETLKRAMMQKQLTQLAEAQGNTFSGVLSTLQDTLQQFLGKIGLPLFKALSAEIKSWNKWLDANSHTVDKWAKSLGEGLVDGFRMVKDALMFLVENKDTLISIAKVWLALKGGQMLGSLGSSIGGGIGALRAPVGGKGKNAIGAAGAMGPLGAAFGVGWKVGTALRPAVDSLIDGVKELTGAYDSAAQRMRAQEDRQARAMALYDEATENAAARMRKAKMFGGEVLQSSAGAADAAASQANVLRDIARWREPFEHKIAALEAKGDDMSLAAAGMLKSTMFSDMGRFPLERQASKYALDDVLGGDAFKTSVEDLRAAAERLAASSERSDLMQTVARTAAMGVYHQQVTSLTPYQRETLDTAKAQERILYEMFRSLQTTGQMLNPYQVQSILKANTEDPMGLVKKDKIKTPSKVNVTIQRIEVKSDDPDRFVFGMVEAFRDAARNPSSAVAALREG